MESYIQKQISEALLVKEKLKIKHKCKLKVVGESLVKLLASPRRYILDTKKNNELRDIVKVLQNEKVKGAEESV